MPIYQTTSFVFEDSADAADLFALQKFGNIYSRIANPTVASFEERMANLEGAIGGVATASGQSAELLTFAALAGAGDHIVASAQLYGGTHTLLDVSLRRFGLDTTFIASDDPDAYAAAIKPNTKAVYTEVIGNPSGSIADLAALADVAHAADVPLVVDGTLATPYLCRPIEHGADIVLHSATKFIGGHGTSIGGVVGRVGALPVGLGPLPADDRTGRLVQRAAVLGELRRVRLLHEAAGRAAPRLRCVHVAVQRVPLPHRARDARAADGAARREREGGRASSSRRTSGCRGCGTPDCPTRRSTSAPTTTCRRVPAQSSRSA